MNQQSPPKKLTRSRNDRYVGGVAAGLAERLNVDPLLVRIAFVVSLALGGLGLIAYGVLLAVMPVDGDPSEPLPPVEPGRRNLMIGLAVVVGIFALFTADSGDFASWAFGFWPGTLFGILFWTAAGVAAIWMIATGKIGRDTFNRSGTQTPPSAPPPPESSPAAPAEASTEVVTYAESPSQLSTEVMETRQMDSDPAPDSEDEEAPAPASPARNDAPSTIGRIMLWFAIGLAALTVFCVLFVISAGTTALFGGVPMAALVIVLGAGMIFAGVRGRRQLSLWLLVSAVAVTVPMATVSIADLRVDGSYGDINETPITMADVPSDGYKMAAGNMTIDLRKFKFERKRELDLPVKSGMGLTSIIVPDRICVAGSVSGKAGITNIRGRQSNGISVKQTAPGPANWKPDMAVRGGMVFLDAEFKLGAFEVVDNTTWRRNGRGGSFDDEGFRPNDASGAAARRRADAACASTRKAVDNSSKAKVRS